MHISSLLRGVSFGLTSGVITTLGLIVGLNSSSGEFSVVVGGILIIAFADAMSDAFGVHMSEESDKKPPKAVWSATISTFVSKLIFALTFIIPFLLFPFQSAIIACIAWGLFLITFFSYLVAKNNKVSPWPVIFEHIILATLVIIITNYIGQFFSNI